MRLDLARRGKVDKGRGKDYNVEVTRFRTMQGSTRIKTHQRPGKAPTRNSKGKHKPVAQRQARARRQALKAKLGV